MGKLSKSALLGASTMIYFGLQAGACADAGTERNEGGGDGDTSGPGGAGAGDGDGDLNLGNGGGGSPDVPRISCDAQKDCEEAEELTGDWICVSTEDGGFCKEASGPCEDNSDCQGDSFCCSGDCRVDEDDEGVCVPFDSDNPVDLECLGDVAIGVMAPSLQCSWVAPPEGDSYDGHVKVLSSPLVIDTPYDAGASNEVLFISSAARAESSSSGVIRIISGQNCEQLANVGVPGDNIIEGATPAVADVDGDGNVEIFVRTTGGTAAYFWDGDAYAKAWTEGPGGSARSDRDGVSIHDLDGDGTPEVIGRHGLVHNAIDGNVRHAGDEGAPVTAPSDPVVGDVDNDGAVELVADDVYEWDGSGWVSDHEGDPDDDGIFYAYADFGTEGGSAAAFDFGTLDGVAEIVKVGSGVVGLYTLSGQVLLSASQDSAAGEALDRGGPPTVSDFDGDGILEFASAGASAYRVWDAQCEAASANCAGESLLWTSSNKDESSAQTGSSVFDFDADGKAEVVYADECYLRVYEGTTGTVLYSAPRTSCTWWESPIIADPDNDGRTEIVVGMNDNCGVDTTCEGSFHIDPVDPGLRCETGEDCLSGQCDAGLCRCTTTDECNGEWVECTKPRDDDTGSGNVCRARALNPYNNSQNPEEEWRDIVGVRIYRDRLDRWASSRPIWNQHAYSVTNINDDQSIPPADEREPNFTADGLNHYRQNRQGNEQAGLLPDITGVLDQESLCSTTANGATLTADVCNRGLRTVGADMPATFYLGEVEPGNILCISYTEGPVPEGDCLPVSCGIAQAVDAGAIIMMVVNDDGTGRGATTEECNLENNTDSVEIFGCVVR